MMYKVVVRFCDLQDDKYVYNAGDTYPRNGLTPSKKRIKELASNQNRRGIPLIQEVTANDADADGDMSGDKKLV